MSLSSNHQVASALGAAAHPLRLDILDAYTARAVESPTDAARLLGASIGNVRHHVRVLSRAGLLAAIGTHGAMSGLENRYEATSRARVLVSALSELE